MIKKVNKIKGVIIISFLVALIVCLPTEAILIKINMARSVFVKLKI